MGDEPPASEEYLREQLEEVFGMKIEQIMTRAYRAAQQACRTYDMPGQAEDLAQEAMIRLIRRAVPSTANHDPIKSPAAYINTAVVNVVKKRATKLDRIGRWGDRRPSLSNEFPEEKAPAKATMHEEIRSSVLGELMHSKLLKLPEHLRRSALAMWSPHTLNFDRITAREAAEMLGIPEGSVRRHLSLSQKEIRERHPELLDLLRDRLAE